MRTSLWPGLIIVGFLSTPLVRAGQDGSQSSHPKTTSPSGSISGSVYCADTNQPARLASIYLFRISESEFGNQSYGRTDLDGRFAINHVAEGDYYVVAVQPGYENLMSSLAKSHLDALPPEERKKLLAQVPRVTVSAHQSAEVSIRLERGAEIDGTVTYDDGSSAIGLDVSYELKTGVLENETNTAETGAARAQTRMMSKSAHTDDQGRFRILGVPPGEYVVCVTVPTRSSLEAQDDRVTSLIGSPFNELDVYVGGGLRASKAEVIKVDTGGAAKDADITIPLSKLHTVRGQVLLKSTGQPPVIANVELLYADTKEMVRTVIVPNGRFEFFYIPEEKFVLRAAAGNDGPPSLDSIDGPNAVPGFHRIVWSYPQAGEDSPEIPLQVDGDMEDQIIAVPDPLPNKKGPSLEIDRGISSGSWSMTLNIPNK